MQEARREVCKVCDKTANEVHLNKCPICFESYCDEHKFLYSGREFCSNHCAQYFFFEDEDA
ncbi:MAG: hypothetical protein R3344_11690 [Acidobacteriota bacterium]|nr:hypothetical protein [Acidobacteriota bacterium]